MFRFSECAVVFLEFQARNNKRTTIFFHSTQRENITRSHLDAKNLVLKYARSQYDILLARNILNSNCSLTILIEKGFYIIDDFEIVI